MYDDIILKKNNIKYYIYVYDFFWHYLIWKVKCLIFEIVKFRSI